MAVEKPLYVNVASSIYVLEDFVNLDNSPILALLPFYPILRHVLKHGHVEWLDKYRQAQKKARLVRHNCLKPLPFAANSVDRILCSHFLEHVYFDQAQDIIAGFHRVLKPGGTLHTIVPDLAVYIDKYVDGPKDETAAPTLLTGTLLTHSHQPSTLFRFLEFIGNFGLQHRWMYDSRSMQALLESRHFTILDDNTTVTSTYRQDDGISLHLVGQKALSA